MPQALIAPVNKTETFAQHFTSRGWTSPRDQINAGYPRFIQPAETTGQFVQTHDLGALITQSCLVNVVLAKIDVVAGVVITPTISVSADGVSWTDYADTYSVYAANFRYVKVTLDFTGDGVALLRINEIKIVVNVEEITDGGRAVADKDDAGGTWVPFAKTFVDVEGVTVTAEHQVGETKGITAVWLLDTEPNPEGIYVFLFSNNTGLRIDGNFGWGVRGS